MLATRSFKDVVDEARKGRLRLPAFQRRWVWNQQKVVKLYDSIRREYPIGSFLFLQSSERINPCATIV